MFLWKQDKDAFLQAAKWTPVDLQEWAISMMESQHRKSYLAPPAPKAINRDGSREVGGLPRAPATEALRSSQPSQSASYYTPTSGEIPLNISNDSPSPYGHYPPPSSNATPTANMSRATPTLPSLEHLSLETQDFPVGDNRQPPRHYPGDPLSAIDTSSRPLFSRGPNTSTKTGLHTATLPMGVAPPPTGPLPPPPMSAGDLCRNPLHKIRSENLA